MKSVLAKIEKLSGELASVQSEGERALPRLLEALDECEREVRGALREKREHSERPESSTPQASREGSDIASLMQQNARKIGHDFNNCLGIVSGRAELVLLHFERGNMDGVRKGLEAILAQMGRMRELVGLLRDLREV